MDRHDAEIQEIKDQLRLCATRLQRAQSKLESTSQATTREITNLLTREQGLRQQYQRASSPSASSSSVSSGIYTTQNGFKSEPGESEAARVLQIARQKAEQMMYDDVNGNIMGVLERSCDVLLEAGSFPERYQELRQEALRSVCAIIAAAPRVEAKELHALRDLLSDRYDELTSTARRQPHVPPSLLQPLLRPSQSEVDTYLVSVAKKGGLDWSPGHPLPAQKLKILRDLLDSSQPGDVDLKRLRELSTIGLPNEPLLIRAKVWRLLLELLPPQKDQWQHARKKSMNDYMDVMRPLLKTLDELSEEQTSPADKYLVQFSRDVDTLPASLRHALDTLADEFTDQSQTELEEDPQNNQLKAVTKRIDHLKGNRGKTSAPIPSITLEAAEESEVDKPDSLAPVQDEKSFSRTSTPTALFDSYARSLFDWHGTLLRLSHIHCTLHASYGLPEGPSSSILPIFAVLLTVFVQDLEDGVDVTESLQQAEADTFWAMERIVGGVRELLGEDGIDGEQSWPQKFSNRVLAVDQELWEDLKLKSLDPALPYFSYDWVPALFSQALPLQHVLPIWDALFTISPFPHTTHNNEAAPMVEFLLDTATSMLTRARLSLFRCGKPKQSGLGLWSKETITLPSLSATPNAYSPVGSPRVPLSPASPAWGRMVPPMNPGETGEAFLMGVKLLQSYNMQEFGGTERLLETTWALWARRQREGTLALPFVNSHKDDYLPNDDEKRASLNAKSNGSGFSKLKETIWKGITNDLSDEGSVSPASPNSGQQAVQHVPPPEVTVTSPTATHKTTLSFGARLADTVWKGVTNQVDSDTPSPEPSPIESRAISPPPIPSKQEQESLSRTSSVGSWATWSSSVAGKLKDSNAAASLSRSATNIRSRALDAWTRRQESTSTSQPQKVPDHPSPSVSSIQLSPTSSVRSSWSTSFITLGKRSSDPQSHQIASGASSPAGHRSSLPSQDGHRYKHDSYSPPPKPAFFRAVRDSVFGLNFQPPDSPQSQASELASPTQQRNSAIQNALASLNGSSEGIAPAKKSGPKPLLLNSRSLITSHSHTGSLSRTSSPGLSNGRRTSSIGNLQYSTDSGTEQSRRTSIASPRSTHYSLQRGSFGRVQRGSQSSISSLPYNRRISQNDNRGLSVDEDSVNGDNRFGPMKRSRSPSGFIVDLGDSQEVVDSPISSSHQRDSLGTSAAHTSPPASIEAAYDAIKETDETTTTIQPIPDQRLEVDQPAIRVDSIDDLPEPKAISDSVSKPLRSKRYKASSLTPVAIKKRDEEQLDEEPLTPLSNAGTASPASSTVNTPTPNTPVYAGTRRDSGSSTLSRRKPLAPKRPSRRKSTNSNEEGITVASTSKTPTPRKSSHGLSPSGSEEEGARADVEDELYGDLLSVY